jgi:peptidoglycan/xylan/chitin deacetylase (PgdA/CDA1 family)
MWTAIARDWKWSAADISKLLLNKAENGAIFCFHDGRELKRNPDIRATLEAVEFLLPVLKERGFSLETVTEILR